MPIPTISQSHINGPMQKRIQTLNEEMQKQRENLPQFKNLNSKVNQMKNCLVNAPSSNYGHQNNKIQYKGGLQNNNQQNLKYKNGSIAALKGNGDSIQYVRENSQEEHVSYKRPNPASRGAVSTNDQSFYMHTHANPRNNFRENLQLLQQQQLLQQNLLERAQQSQSFTIKKKKFKKPLYEDNQTNFQNQPSNILLYEGTDQFMNEINNQSAIGVLRNAAQARPEMDTYSHDYQIQKYAHNFNNHLKLQRNNFGRGQIIMNNQSQPKMAEIRMQKSPALKKKRRLINAQYDGVYSQFDYIQDTQNLAYQMTKSATDFNKNMQKLQALQQGITFQGQSNITTPILKKGKHDNTIVLSEQMENFQPSNLIDENNQMKTAERAITQMVYSTEDLRKIQEKQLINNNKNIIKNYVRIQEEEYAKKH